MPADGPSRASGSDILDNLPVAVYRTSVDGRILAINRAGVEMFGCTSKQELLEIRVADTYAEPDEREQHIEERRVAGEQVRSVLKLRRQDGSTFWARDTSRSILDEEGRLAFIDGTLEDITAEVEAREALRRSEAEFRTVHERSPAAILTLGPDGRIVQANPAAERLLGHDRDALVGQGFADITHPEDRKDSQKGFEALESGEADEVRLEKRYVRADGRTIWAAIRAVAVRRKDGSLRAILSLIDDVTERRQHIEELELFRRLSHVMDAAETLDDAFQAVIDTVCERMGWTYGEAWELGDDGELHCLPATRLGRDGLQKFRRLSERVTFAPGRGLPGRAYEERGPVWVDDLASDRTFLRAREARAVGLKSGIAVPVRRGDLVTAVLVFLTEEADPKDEAAAHLLFAVATQLGATAARRRTEERLRKRARLLEAVTENSEEAFLALSLEGDVLAADRNFLRMAGALGEGDLRPAVEVLPEALEDEAFLHALSFLYTVSRGGEKDQVEWNKVLYRRRSVPLKGRDGEVLGRVLYFRAEMELA